MTYTDYKIIHRYKHNNLCWLKGEDELVGLFIYFYKHIVCICHISCQKKKVFFIT